MEGNNTLVKVSPPGRPKLIQGTRSTSIVASWSEPSGGADEVLSYEVAYRAVTDLMWTECPDYVEKDDCDLEIFNLQQGCSYLVRVRAKHRNGFSDNSKPSKPFEILPAAGNRQEPDAQENISVFPESADPGKAVIENVSHESVQLHWNPPGQSYAALVKEYEIHLKMIDDLESTRLWESRTECKNLQSSKTICGLPPAKHYTCKITAVYESTTCSSQEEVTFQTLPCSPPGTVVCKRKGMKVVQLCWTKPDVVGECINIDGYELLCKSIAIADEHLLQKENWMKAASLPSECCEAELSGTPGYVYSYCVIALCGNNGSSLYSSQSDTVYFQKGEREICKEAMKDASTKIDSEKSIYLLKAENIQMGVGITWKKKEVGERNIKSAVPERVVMLLGETGSGKSTMINAIANYVFNVNWNDKFRFKLIPDDANSDIVSNLQELKKEHKDDAPRNKQGTFQSKFGSQAHSQTQCVTSYTIHHVPGLCIPFTLTILDTPGFGHTGGIKKDSEIFNQLKSFFENDREGIDHIDAVGFIVKASNPRLTEVQRYIFDSVLQLFGKDIEKNVFMLTTFADGHDPQVLHAVKEYDMKYREFYKFNNSALFTDSNEKGAANTAFDKLFWDMGVSSLESFLHGLEKLQSQSLTLTRQVLHERMQLQIHVESLEESIENALYKLEEYRIKKEAIHDLANKMRKNKKFSFSINKVIYKQMDLPKGKLATNCQTCKLTCHYPCSNTTNLTKLFCKPLLFGYCSNCKDSCKVGKHKSENFKYVRRVEKVTETIDEMKEQYERAAQRHLEEKQLIIMIEEEKDKCQLGVLSEIERLKECLNRLNELALSKQHYNSTEYIDMLISQEERNKRPGWTENIKELQTLRERATTIKLAGSGDLETILSFHSLSEEIGQDEDYFDTRL